MVRSLSFTFRMQLPLLILGKSLWLIAGTLIHQSKNFPMDTVPVVVPVLVPDVVYSRPTP